MRLLKSFAVSLALMLVGLSASAQNRVLSGVVLDQTDSPLVGVAVIIDGTTDGKVTAEDGTFSLMVPEGQVVLSVSSLGYVTKKVTVSPTQDNLKIYLAEDTILLEETVVVHNPLASHPDAVPSLESQLFVSFWHGYNSLILPTVLKVYLLPPLPNVLL